jgi:hypothetical protein
MTNNLQNTSNNLTQGGYNEGDDDAGVFEDLDMIADPHQMLTIDHQPQSSNMLYKPNKQSSLVHAKQPKQSKGSKTAKHNRNKIGSSSSFTQ